jgi:hydrogenase expression/formation protein HypE
MSHGSGGEKYRELVQEIFLPAYCNEYLSPLTDSAILAGEGKIAMTTDSYVVKPLFFPGGNIGNMSVSGTVNDLAVSGALPKYISVGMIIEAGLEIKVLKRIVDSIADTAKKAGVKIVTGDTKVVESKSADGIFINTAGVGVFPSGRKIPSQKIKAGDKIIVSGCIASHGMAVMNARNNLGFLPPIESDAAPLGNLVSAIFKHDDYIVHAMRDPTRGGVAATLCEWVTSGTDIVIYQKSIPIRSDVSAACRLLGLDPLHIANEGVILFSVPENCANDVLSVLRKEEYGKYSAIIGEVREGSGTVSAITDFGSKTRIMMPKGEILPRIC